MTPCLDDLPRLHAEWRAVLGTRANVLVTGPRDRLNAFAAACRDELRSPVTCTSAAHPVPPEPARTLVIPGIHRLDAVAQAELAAWMQGPDNADTQVISLSAVPLFSRVQSGTFDRDLYYRLNTIHLSLTDTTAAPLAETRTVGGEPEGPNRTREQWPPALDDLAIAADRNRRGRRR